MTSVASRASVIAAYAGMCLIWGTTWLGIKIGLQTLPPLTGVGLRFAIAGLLLAIVAAARGEIRPLRAYPWRVIAVLGLLLFSLNYVLNYVAETRLDSGLVSVLFGTMPFFTFAIGASMIGERARLVVLLGAILAFAGVAVISLAGEIRGSMLFVLCGIAAAATAALGNVYAKAHSHQPPLVTLPPAMFLSGAIVTVLGLLFERTQWSAVLTPQSLGALLYLAIFGSCIAFFLMMWLLQRIPAYTVSLGSLIYPIVALSVGVAFGGEHVGARELAGSALVIAGLALALAPRGEPSAETRLDTT